MNALQAWRAANTGKLRDLRRQYDLRHPERRRKSKSDYRERNAEKIRRADSALRATPERKAYMYEYCQRRNAAKLNATPRWASFGEMRAIYARAAELRRQGQDVHVDHIVPLKSALVCGLHCEANLQVIHAKANHAKLNKFWPDIP